MVLRITGLLGWDRFNEWVGDGEEGRDRGAWRRPLARRSLDFLAGTGGGTGGFLGWILGAILSPVDSGGGLDAGTGEVGDWGVAQAGLRGSWEGTGGLDFGLSAAPFCFLEQSDFAFSNIALNSAQVCSKWISPNEWDLFHGPGCWNGPSKSSQLRLAGIGDRLWDLRSPSRLNPFRECLEKKFLGNFVRWFLPFCCRVSLEMVMGRVG